MDRLYIEASEVTPRIVMDKKKGKFLISGRSLPENVELAYSPLIQWLNEYMKDANDETVLEVNLDYYNSSSLRKIADILIILKKIQVSTNTKVSVSWYYEDGDETSMENAEDLSSAVDIPFDMIKY